MKGQVSVFMIVAILIVAVGAAIFFTSRPQPVQQIAPGEDVTAIRSFVQSCLDESALEGVKELGLTGGVVIPLLDRPSEIVNGRYVAIYRIGNDLLKLKNPQVEGYLAEWIAVRVAACTHNLMVPVRSLPLLPEVQASIGENVVVSASVPIRIPSGQGETIVPSEYSARVPIRLLPFLDEARSWAKEEADNNGRTDLFRLAAMGQKGWAATVVPWTDGAIVILIEDQSQALGNEPFAFQFATAKEVAGWS